jgi:hypothetical protein
VLVDIVVVELVVVDMDARRRIGLRLDCGWNGVLGDLDEMVEFGSTTTMQVRSVTSRGLSLLLAVEKRTED